MVAPTDPPPPGLPAGTESGGPLFAPPNIQRPRGLIQDTRGGCATPILPINSEIGLTTAEYPTFLIAVRDDIEEQIANFTLSDEQGEVYQTSFRIGGKGGIVRIALPANAGITPLLIGKDYRWSFSINCDNEVDTADGWIRRVEPSSTLAEQLQQATGRDRVLAYAANGIWYDAVATLAELRRANPDDPKLASDWTILLTQVGLKDVAERKLIEP